jgi:hypothetical protein
MGFVVSFSFTLYFPAALAISFRSSKGALFVKQLAFRLHVEELLFTVQLIVITESCALSPARGYLIDCDTQSLIHRGVTTLAMRASSLDGVVVESSSPPLSSPELVTYVLLSDQCSRSH